MHPYAPAFLSISSSSSSFHRVGPGKALALGRVAVYCGEGMPYKMDPSLSMESWPPKSACMYVFPSLLMFSMIFLQMKQHTDGHSISIQRLQQFESTRQPSRLVIMFG